jgi:hypothetical protein
MKLNAQGTTTSVMVLAGEATMNVSMKDRLSLMMFCSILSGVPGT